MFAILDNASIYYMMSLFERPLHLYFICTRPVWNQSALISANVSMIYIHHPLLIAFFIFSILRNSIQEMSRKGASQFSELTTYHLLNKKKKEDLDESLNLWITTEYLIEYKAPALSQAVP